MAFAESVSGGDDGVVEIQGVAHFQRLEGGEDLRPGLFVEAGGHKADLDPLLLQLAKEFVQARSGFEGVRTSPSSHDLGHLVVDDVKVMPPGFLNGLVRAVFLDAVAQVLADGMPRDMRFVSGLELELRVAILCGPKSELVGFLPEETDDILDQAGSYAELYALRHLKISGMSAGKTTKLQLELVRPDLRQCSACGVLHPGAFENCSECRSRRRRKRMPLEETAERPPVPLHGAIRAVAQNPLLESELPEKK